MINFEFKIKSNWFEKGVMKKIGDKGFWVYIIINQFVLKHSSSISRVSINSLYKELKISGVNLPKKEIVKIIQHLKSLEVLNYDKNINFNDINAVIDLELMDLPKMHRQNIEGEIRDVPIGKDDIWFSIETETLLYIISKELSIKHVLAYLAVKKYSYSQQNTVSCDKISKWTGLGKNQINEKYLVDLEKIGLIKNNISKNALGHRQNNFIVYKYRDFFNPINKINGY